MSNSGGEQRGHPPYDRLRQIVEAAQLGTFALSPQTGYARLSEQARDQHGLSHDSACDYAVFLASVHPEDRDRVDHAIRDACQADGSVFETEYRTAGVVEGRRRWIAVQGRPSPDRNDSSSRLIGITLDVTARRQAEQHLADSQQRLELAVESAPNSIIMTDARGRIVLVNAQTEKLFGYERKELIGQSVEMLVPERFRGRHEGYRHGFMADPQTRPMGAGRELFGLHKNGTEVPVEIGLNPIRTNEGILVLASIVDISERKRSEETLRRQVDLLEQTYDAIFVWEFDGPIVYWNRGAEQLYGYSRREAVDRMPRDLLKTSTSATTTDFRAALLETGRWTGELYHQTADGRRIMVESRLAMVRYGTGRQYVLETTHDITDRKRAEEQLKSMNETLERQVARRTTQLRAMAAELSQAEQRERHRLAQILHDQLQQLLVGAKFNIDTIRSQSVGRQRPRIVAAG